MDAPRNETKHQDQQDDAGHREEAPQIDLHGSPREHEAEEPGQAEAGHGPDDVQDAARGCQ